MERPERAKLSEEEFLKLMQTFHKRRTDSLALFERARIEVHVPDLPEERYRGLLEALDREFTHSFGGCTIQRGLDGSYLSKVGLKIRIAST